MYHDVFIHPSVDAHLYCFHILAIIMSEQVSLELVSSFSLGIYPGVELLDHMLALFLVLGGTSILFSIVAAPIYIPTNSVGGFLFLDVLTNNSYLWPF